MLILNTMLVLGCGLSWHFFFVSLGLVMGRGGGVFLTEHDVHCGFECFKCVSRTPDLLLSAARFTTGYVRLVGQELAPSKCVLLSTSRVVREDMKNWVLSQEGDRWSVKFDVRDLGRTFGYSLSWMVFDFSC